MIFLALSVSSLTASRRSGESSGCGGALPPLPQPGQHEMFDVAVSDPQQGELTRQFSLHLPAPYPLSNTQPVPLVLDYHWWGGSASSQVSNYPWPHLADTDTTPFIYLALQVRLVRQPSLGHIWTCREWLMLMERARVGRAAGTCPGLRAR